MKISDAWMSTVTENPTVESLGLLTALALSVWLIAKRQTGSWSKPVVWLVQGGLKAWLDKEVFEPQQKENSRRDEQIRALQAENIRLVGFIEGMQIHVNNHEERLRQAEITAAALTAEQKDNREEIALLRSGYAVFSQNLADQAEAMAALTASNDAILASQGMAAQDLRQMGQNIHALTIHLIPKN